MTTSATEEKKYFPFKKRISHVFEFVFVIILYLFVNLWPWSKLHSLANGIRILFYPLLKSPRRRVASHVREILGITDEKELERFVATNLTHSIRCWLEVVQMWKLRNKKFCSKYIEFTPGAIELTKEKNQGIVFAAGHFGNWEIPIIAYSNIGFVSNFSAQHLSNPYVDKMLHTIRKGYRGGEIIYLKESHKFIPVLRSKQPLGLVSDQDAGHDGIFIPFMGKMAATHTGPAILAYLGKARLGVGFCVFQGNGHYRFDARIVYTFKSRQDFKNTEEAARELTVRWVKELETEVMKCPEQYFWVHRRWKTQPDSTHV